MLNKNEDYEILIDDMGNEGEGIGHIDGMAVFVKDALIGDRILGRIIKSKKSFAYARVMEIIKPSPFRVKPICDKARPCGGCSIMHMDYEKQLEYKFNKVKNCLQRIGGVEDAEKLMEPIYGMKEPYHYRNKAQFPVSRDKDGKLSIGFYAGRTHSVIDTDTCYLQAPVNDKIISAFREYMDKYNISAYDEISGKGLVRHILTRVGFTTGEIMVCIIVNGGKLPHQEDLIESLSKIDGMKSISININKDNTNRILGDKVVTLWGADYITDYIGDIAFNISPLSFYQVNPVQTKVLYGKALEYAGLTGNEVVWDMYCGIGTISLFLAPKALKVFGVEIVKEAIDDARRNAQLNHISNVEFFVGKAEEVVPRCYAEDKAGKSADVVVVDPPRKGCDSILLDTLGEMAPCKIVYVSCDPATLARDVAILRQKGYEVKKAAVVDQFAHTGHVETCALLTKTSEA